MFYFFGSILSIFNKKFEKIAKIILIALTVTPTMHAQQDFGTYMNKIFFNVYSDAPDSSIRKFLNDFAPVLLHPPENTTKWTAYATADFRPPVVITHSYVFHKHPFIYAAFKQGEFKVFTSVNDDGTDQKVAGIKSIQVTLEFEELDDAARLFEQVRKDLMAIAQEETYLEEKSKRFSVIYSSDDMYRIPCGIRITLGTERNINSLYQVSFQ